ncbi:hypothetical protein [Pseudonocardia sp. ICBG1142]|uniref:hypothetical protein n=1 Tax=Pseudonocardia sp. ICBG1142 TaxID=2846760 RepID=UPI001CF6DDAC|nr:hypothetical protein [Pseudonocardia sp. ICBG1142]
MPPRIKPGAPDPNRFGTISERLNYLASTIRRPNGTVFPATDIVRWIRSQGGGVSDVYITKILNGTRGKEPSPTYTRWLARYYNVADDFFYTDHPETVDGPAHTLHILVREPAGTDLLHNWALLPERQRDIVSALITSMVPPHHRHAISTTADNTDTDTGDGDGDGTDSADDNDSDPDDDRDDASSTSTARARQP